MKFALCDDDPNDLQQIRDYLLHYDAQADWKSFTSSKELLASFQCDYFDIVLLDIEMDGIKTATRRPRNSINCPIFP